MRDFVATTLDSEKNRLAQPDPLIWLIEVEVPTVPPTRFRITNYNDTVSFGSTSLGVGLQYSPFPALHGEISQSGKGDLRDFQVSVGNVTLELMSAIDSYAGLIGQSVVLKLVSSVALNDPNAVMRHDGKISACSVDFEKATFTIGATNLTKANFPKNRYVANHCRWRYGGSECGYIIPASPTNVIGGGFSSCGRTLAECDIRGLDEAARAVTVQHPLRFGGFPGTRVGQPAS